MEIATDAMQIVGFAMYVWTIRCNGASRASDSLTGCFHGRRARGTPCRRQCETPAPPDSQRRTRSDPPTWGDLLRDRFHPVESLGHTGNGNGHSIRSKNNAADASPLPPLPPKGGTLTISTPHPGADITQITGNTAQLRWCHTELFGHQFISSPRETRPHHDRRSSYKSPTDRCRCVIV